MFESIREASEIIKSFNLGNIIANGNYSNIYEPSKKLGMFDGYLLLTVEETKLKYLESLYSLYDLQFKYIGEISNGLFAINVPKLEEFHLMSNNIKEALDYVNNYFIDQSFQNTHEFEISPAELFNDYFFEYDNFFSKDAQDISNSIDDAFLSLNTMKEGCMYRIDLHEEQFCEINGTAICIDPVIFE